ncbi:unnamed protein product [Mycena citricolor]|uniref:Uncharacterized protein n=1 Tax=Mycena citricolor TaxID=2018698 RepID=A0AAD2H939_9AGAR|nr:unnamed protein product [Mycena citricolor]
MCRPAVRLATTWNQKILRHAFSSFPSPRLPQKKDNKVTNYLHHLLAASRDPLWRVVLSLDKPLRVSLFEALDDEVVKLQDFTHWRTRVYSSDIQDAFETAPVVSPSSYPPWLALYLAAFKVRSSHHASGPLVDLSLSLHPTNIAERRVLSSTVQASILVITMMHLCRFSLVAPMHNVLDAFLQVPLAQDQDFPSLHFNHLLLAMASIPQRSHDMGGKTVRILQAMEARQLKLWPKTYKALLEDRYVALRLTSYLRRQQTQLGIVPDAAQLESYLRIYAQDGAIHHVGQYAKAVRGHRAEHDANVMVLQNKPSSASAFQFLANLAQKQLPDRQLLTIRKKAVDAADFTAALSVAARDPRIDTRRFKRLFQQRRPKAAEFQPTLAMHTVFIQGLLDRREWRQAYMHWTKVTWSGLTVDEVALGVGLQAATLSGQPGEAFALLELHAARADAAFPATHQSRKPVHVSIGLVNIFMRSLHSILRPDLVFRLWDWMDSLYYLRPSPETLRIMLAAAELPYVLDDSVKGQIAHLALRNPFRHSHTPLATRQQHIETLIQQSSEPYRSGIWRDRPAAHAANHMFLQALFGDASRRPVANVPPPAFAVRPHAESDSAALRLRLDMPPSSFVLPTDISTPEGKTWFPELVVGEREFASYIMFLGMNRRAPEIARALGWMRALDIKPSERTLGTALAFWSEVSVQPPLVAAIAGKNADQFLALMGWLREWCGAELVPDEQTVGWWRAKIDKIRAQRRQMAKTGRFVDEESIWKM